MSKKTGLTLIILLIISVIIWFFTKNPFINKKENIKNTQVSSLSQLPDGWSVIQKNENNLLFKLVKKSQDSVKPSVVLIDNPYDNNQPFPDYINKIIKGAKATIPSLVYDPPVFDGDSVVLNGSYLKSKSRIYLSQKIFIQNNKIYTLTASYLPDKLSAPEIDQVFNYLISSLHPPN